MVSESAYNWQHWRQMPASVPCLFFGPQVDSYFFLAFFTAIVPSLAISYT
jgi:hypothetical protein